MKIDNRNREPKHNLRIQPYVAGGGQLASGGGSFSLTVREQDNSPSVSDVTEIRVTNGTLTDEGGGVVSITIAGNIDGSGAATRLAIWSDADTLTSDAGLTYLTASDILTVSGSNPFVNVTDGGSPATITSISAGDLALQKVSTTLSPALTLSRVRASLDFPDSGDVIGVIDFRSSDGATNLTPARISVTATQNHSASLAGCSFAIAVAPNGTTTRVERISIDSAGLIYLNSTVGIGTASPQDVLEVSSGSSNTRVRITTTIAAAASEIYFNTNSRDYLIGAGGSGASGPAANQWYLYDVTAGGNAYRITLDSNGQVGINPGGSTVATTLHVFGHNASVRAFRIDTAAAQDVTVPAAQINLESATSNAVANSLTLAAVVAVGNASDGFGQQIRFLLESSSTVDQDAANIRCLWTTATHASRTAAIVIQTVTGAASAAEVVRFGGVAAVLITARSSDNEGLRVVSNSGSVIVQVTSDGTDAFIGTSTNHTVVLQSNGSANIRYTSSTLGFYGVTPVARQTAAAVATDLTSVVTLANQLRQDLIDLGLMQA